MQSNISFEVAFGRGTSSNQEGLVNVDESSAMLKPSNSLPLVEGPVSTEYCSSGVEAACERLPRPAIGISARKATKANALIRFITYFLLYPEGQVGFTAVTLFVLLPFTQLIVIFFATADAFAATGAGVGVFDEAEVAAGVGEGVPVGSGEGVSWVNFT